MQPISKYLVYKLIVLKVVGLAFLLYSALLIQML